MITIDFLSILPLYFDIISYFSPPSVKVETLPHYRMRYSHPLSGGSPKHVKVPDLQSPRVLTFLTVYIIVLCTLETSLGPSVGGTPLRTTPSTTRSRHDDTSLVLSTSSTLSLSLTSLPVRPSSYSLGTLTVFGVLSPNVVRLSRLSCPSGTDGGVLTRGVTVSTESEI